jgi:hypothetical protein
MYVIYKLREERKDETLTKREKEREEREIAEKGGGRGGLKKKAP